MQVPLSRGNVLVNSARLACFQLDSLNLAENIANRAPCPGSNLTWVHQLRLSRNLVCTGTHYDYEVLMVEAGANDTIYVLYNFWALTISVRRLDAFLERECMSHWVEVMYLWIAPGWQCFQLGSLNLAENIANRAPCPGSNLTWVHQLRLSRNLVCTGNHYDYEVLMVEAGVEIMCWTS